MSIKYRQGDLFESGLPALAHGVNCQGLMGAGIAKGFADRWPAMREAYEGVCRNRNLGLGAISSWEVPDGPVIFNLATQWLPGQDARPWAIAASIGRMVLLAQVRGIAEVGMPLIGCGIGGLTETWLDLILKPYEQAPVDLIVYRYMPPQEGA